MRKCKNIGCDKLFEPSYNSIQPCCSVKCAIELGRVKQAQKAFKEHKAKKKEITQDRSWHLKNTQKVFNQFIRLRDKGDNCISCQKPAKKENAGHYRSVGAAPELRFEELNCHLQCEHCNSYKSGNIGEYRIHLIKKLGVEKVDWIESYHSPRKYTIDELKELTAHYRTLIKGMD